MILFINTSDRDRIVVGLDGKMFETKSHDGASQKLLPFVKEVLRKEGKSLSDISEIKVNTGPGSFTGLRVGVAVASTLGWALGVPVNGKKMAKGGVVKLKYE